MQWNSPYFSFGSPSAREWPHVSDKDKAMAEKEAQSCVTCLGLRSTSWCPSHSQGTLAQDPFWQPWGLSVGFCLLFSSPKCYLLRWRWTQAKTSLELIQKSLPSVFQWKSFNNLLNKPTARESSFPIASGVTNMPNSNSLRMKDWRAWASLPFFLFFSPSMCDAGTWFLSRGEWVLSHCWLRVRSSSVHTDLHALKGREKGNKKPDLPGNSQNTACLSASSSWKESTPPLPCLAQSSFCSSMWVWSQEEEEGSLQPGLRHALWSWWWTLYWCCQHLAL